MTKRMLLASAAAGALLAGAFGGVPAANAQGEVNLYSSRHYDTDERLYDAFTEKTGIEVNRLEDGADKLIERMRTEGRNSPADVLITVDAGRLWRADEAGLLQGIESERLDAAIPDHLQDPEGKWFGLSQRARIIFYDKDDVENPPQTYEALADPQYEGMVCTRSSSNIYMLSLMASIIEANGEEAAEEWAEGVWNNRARDPQGGDTDQLRAIISGECDIVLSNHYYYARGLRKEVEGLTGSADQIGWVFPNQDGRGTHVNISGAGVATHAPNRENAIRFIEYLATPEAQAYFAEGNDEIPVVEGVSASEEVATMIGDGFEADDLPLAVLGENQALAQQIYDRVGYR